MNNLATYLVLALLLSGLVFMAVKARQSSAGSSSEAENFVIGGRAIGPLVLLLSMGATYFSTWTLLGSFGSYYRSGVWFAGFTVWTIFQAMFIWLFGTRIWLAGKTFNFLTPGQMIEDYYDSRRMRILVSVIGIVALVPVMLIQVSGAAQAMATLTNDGLPYWLGVLIVSVLVGVIVLWAGFRGTAWGDAFMGIFFACVMIGSAIFIVLVAGGFDLFRSVQAEAPDLVVNRGEPIAMLELWLSLSFGAWVLPHMWQKFYSASSPDTLGKVMVASPFWNSWMMALIPLLIGMAAIIPGVIPGVTTETSDMILPQIFTTYAPLLGAFVVAGILAAGISTVNSQLLSAASLVAYDLYSISRGGQLSERALTQITRIVVGILTLIVLVLALSPGGRGFLVPVASLGFGLGLQLAPSALGVLHFPRITEAGAFAGLICGTAVMALVAAVPGISPFGPAITGFFANCIVTAGLSAFTAPVPRHKVEKYHGMFDAFLSRNTVPDETVRA